MHCAICEKCLYIRWEYINNIYTNTFLIFIKKVNVRGIIYPILVKIIYCGYNSQVTKDIINIISNYLESNIMKYYKEEYNSYDLVGTSETTRATKYKYKYNSNSNSDVWFNEWLSGLIDGDGSLLVSKKGYSSCEITMDLKDEKVLKFIQNKLGGSIKLRSGVKALRWRLHNKVGMINLINRVNGNIRHSSRLKQLYKVCNLLDIEVILPKPLTRNNAWFIGFFDADGTINYSIKDKYPQLTISVTNKLLLDIQPYKDIFGGNIYYDKGCNGSFKWCIQSKTDILDVCNILKYSKSNKVNRIFLVNRYYELLDLKAYKTLDNGGSELLYKAWLKFESKW